jgi:putative nucleotidyltransferase with HDIG domain
MAMQTPDTSAHPRLLAARLEAWAGAGGFDVPLLPEAAQEAMRAATSDVADARRLTEIIRRDQSLASHVLSVANSPLYMGRTRILSLQQAVSRLGMTTIRQIALTVACQARVFRVVGQEARVREMFRHSLATSFVAQEIARILKRNVEEAFLAGLLHDIGAPLVLEAVLHLAKELTFEPTDDMIARALDTLHAQVGAAVARSWGFLPGLVEAIEHHHDPVGAKTYGALAGLVALADDVADVLGSAGDPPELARFLGHPGLRLINLYPEDLEKLLARGPEVLAWAEMFT